MNYPKPAKRLALASSAIASFAIPILAGLLLQNAALAQDDVSYDYLDDAGNGDYVAIAKVAPVYPLRALQRGLEGYVIIEYTITTAGTTRDPVVVETTNPVFDRAATESARYYKYRPRVVDGQAIEVPGVQTKIIFELEE